VTADAKTYHHGDLRNALIIAAAELIQQSGSLNFAMADAARRAGVSSAAPYRHFRDKDALLEAVSQLAFYGLGLAAKSAVENTPRGSIEAIIAIGHTYLEYVTEKAAFYDLMWGDLGARAMDSDSFDKKASGFYQLVDVVEAFLQANAIHGEDVLDIAVKLWTMVHGLSAISMSGKLPHFHPNADLREILASATRTFMAGLEAQAGQNSGRLDPSP
jgi:AcrR family transcriptional regulator